MNTHYYEGYSLPEIPSSELHSLDDSERRLCPDVPLMNKRIASSASCRLVDDWQEMTNKDAWISTLLLL